MLKKPTAIKAGDTRAGLQLMLGNALATLGSYETDKALLKQAINVYRAALKKYTPKRDPLDWAATQNNLGVALHTLGQRESDPNAS